MYELFPIGEIILKPFNGEPTNSKYVQVYQIKFRDLRQQML